MQRIENLCKSVKGKRLTHKQLKDKMLQNSLFQTAFYQYYKKRATNCYYFEIAPKFFCFKEKLKIENK